MTAIIFPTSPTLDQVFTSGDRSWTWNGITWSSVSSDSLIKYNVDGGKANTNYGGITNINGGNAGSL